MASVQIPEDLFIDLIRVHLLDINDQAIEDRIRQALQTKLDALTRRQLYTDSKTGTSAETREQARQRYLDLIGIPDDFRY